MCCFKDATKSVTGKNFERWAWEGGITEAEVNEWAEKVKNAGGNIFHEVERDEANYYGFAFADPDGHKFNVLLWIAGCDKILGIRENYSRH